MNGRKGFTLLEVLVVIVISASVLLFAVPAYKRTQDKSAYIAAQGVLVELRAAVQALRQDLQSANSSVKIPPGSTPVQLQSSWQDSSSGTYNTVVTTDTASLTAAQLPYALFAQKYIQPVPFDKNANTYKKYNFYICPETTSSSNCCAAQVVSCMMDPNYCSRATKGLYYGAQMKADGRIVALTKSDCE